MDSDNSIQIHDQTARDYDRLSVEFSYTFADALFGLCFEFLQPGQRLLDIGIGTGLSSIPFHRAGLEVYGVDGSSEMLRICREKHFAVELRQWDLRILPWP
jgi:ubiquinone/menaquinone biosynthesis C-methylase UbiE